MVFSLLPASWRLSVGISLPNRSTKCFIKCLSTFVVCSSGSQGSFIFFFSHPIAHKFIKLTNFFLLTYTLISTAFRIPNLMIWTTNTFRDWWACCRCSWLLTCPDFTSDLIFPSMIFCLYCIVSLSVFPPRIYFCLSWGSGPFFCKVWSITWYFFFFPFSFSLHKCFLMRHDRRRQASRLAPSPPKNMKKGWPLLARNSSKECNTPPTAKLF